MKHSSGNPLMASIPEACELLRVRTSTINRLLREGRLPRCKIGRRTLIPVSALQNFVNGMLGAA